MSDDHFDIDGVLEDVEHAIRRYPRAAMFELAHRGHNSLFEQLVGCIISVRTYDEDTLPCALRLFAKARTPAEMVALSVQEIEAAIAESSYPEGKSHNIRAIAVRAVDDFEGTLPADDDVIRSFKGVGPKCANLALSIACGLPRISVDIHVHRVVNRWGYVEGKTPVQTLEALEKRLPERHWVDINRLLIPFGKRICGYRPRCRRCPLRDRCERVGV